jgi:hypothetical protein
MYVACIADIVSAPRNQDPETLRYKDQECVLAPAGMTHIVENLRDTPFRNIVAEFLPKARELRRTTTPWPGRPTEGVFEINGKFVRIRRLFDDDGTAAIYSVSLQKNAEVEIQGPAIIASPYEASVEVEESEGRTVKLYSFNSLCWLSPGKGVLRNTGAARATAVVFQIGARAEDTLSVRRQERTPIKTMRAQADEPARR